MDLYNTPRTDILQLCLAVSCVFNEYDYSVDNTFSYDKGLRINQQQNLTQKDVTPVL